MSGQVLRTVVGWVGVVVAIVSALFFAVFVGELATGGDGKTSFGAYLGLIVFFGLTMATGAWLAWTRLRGAPDRGGHREVPPDAPPSSAAEREQRVLDFAAGQGGRVTLAEVASECNLTVDESKAALDTLVLQGVAELQVSERGVLVYVFPGFMSDDAKAKAEGI